MKTALTLALFLVALVGCAEGSSHRRRGSVEGPPTVATDAGVTPWIPDGGGFATRDAPIVLLGTDAGPTGTSPTTPDAGETVMPGVPALRCGRTYDHETTFLVRRGAPDLATIRHRDGTSLPAEEGGGSCGGGSGCSEEVTLLCDGDAIAGVLERAATFSVQGAQSAEPGTGHLVVTIGGAELPSMDYAVGSSSLPGFVNGPQPAAPVPTLARTEVSVRAEGGCVWVRAVTVTCPAN